MGATFRIVAKFPFTFSMASGRIDHQRVGGVGGPFLE